MPSVGNLDIGDISYIYNGTDCVEQHYTSSGNKIDMYYTYSNGRMTSAVELKNNDTVIKVNIHSYTADGYIRSLTFEDIQKGIVADYEFTWENGDLTSLLKHPVQPTGEDVSQNFNYDNYPNANTGIPVADAIFSPETMGGSISKHNQMIGDDESGYKNGRLVTATRTTPNETVVTCYTYSDGTTGKE